MDSAFLIAALSIGFMGSFHCIGMCGPLALALPVQHLQGIRKITGILLYNLGRIITYALLGLLFGWLGSRFALFGWQQVLSIVLGVVMLVMGMALLFRKHIGSNKWIQKFWNQHILRLLLPFMKNPKLGATFIVGILNGLLPCGLVYMAIAGSIASSDWLLGATFMATFGLGTLPAMLFVGIAGSLISIQWKNYIKKLSPIVMSLMGLLLVLRGLNLNIPYVSPKMEASKISCCHP